MKIWRLIILVTIVILGVMIFLLSQTWRVGTDRAALVLHSFALEMVDDHGRVRASIKMQPVDQTVRMPKGKKLHQTVSFRLIDPNGWPSVKLTTLDQDAAL